MLKSQCVVCGMVDNNTIQLMDMSANGKDGPDVWIGEKCYDMQRTKGVEQVP